jgi:aldehyde:ferredoxin oxidoreductase
MRILRINTRTQEYAFEELGEYAGLGGRALTSRVVNKEVPADCHALSAENKLVFASGVLACTNAANSGRVSVGSKSPLTGGIKESNSGGQFANQMGKMDLQAIILEDKPEDDSDFTNIFISKDEVKFTSAKEIVGMQNYPAQEKLQEEFGQKSCYLSLWSCWRTLYAGSNHPVLRPRRAPYPFCWSWWYGCCAWFQES